MTDVTCPLCSAAQEYDGEEENLAALAKKHGFTERQLRLRLGLAVPTRTVWDEARVQELTNLVNDGASMEELARHFSISVTRIKQVIADKNIDTSTGDRVRATNRAERAAEISRNVLAVYQENPKATPDEIAEKVGSDDVTAKTVRQILTGLGLKVAKSQPTTKAAKKSASSGKKNKKTAKKTAAPSGATDESVVIDDTPTVKRVAEYLASVDEGSSPTLEGYIDWAEVNNAPSSTEVRKEFGSWARAKKAAEALSG